MNQIEKQPKPETVVEQIQEVLPPTSVEELKVPQEFVISEVSIPPISIEKGTDVAQKAKETEPKLSYGFPLEIDSNDENPANIVAEKINGFPPKE